MSLSKRKNRGLNIDDLAAMVQRGFEETAKKADVNRRFDDVNRRFDQAEHHLERFEKVILADYGRRLKRLEADVDYLKDALAIK